MESRTGDFEGLPQPDQRVPPRVRRLPDDVLLLVLERLSDHRDVLAMALAGNMSVAQAALRRLYELFLASYAQIPSTVRTRDRPVRVLDLAPASILAPLSSPSLSTILTLLRPTLWELKLGRGDGGSMFDAAVILEVGDADAKAADGVDAGPDKYLTTINLGRSTYSTKPSFLRRLSHHPRMSLTLRHLAVSLFPAASFVSDEPPTFFSTVLSRLVNLESLYVHSTNSLDDPFLHAVAQTVPNLLHLGISYTRGFTIDAIHHALTQKGPRLKSLQAQDVPAFWRDVAVHRIAECCTGLERLDLSAPRSVGEHFGGGRFETVRVQGLVEWAFAPDETPTPTTATATTASLRERVQPRRFLFPHLTVLILSHQTAITDTDVLSLVAASPGITALGLGGCRQLTVAALNAVVERLAGLREFKFDAVGVEERHLGWWGGRGLEYRRVVEGERERQDPRDEGERGHQRHVRTHSPPPRPTPLVSLSLSFTSCSRDSIISFSCTVSGTLQRVGNLPGFSDALREAGAGRVESSGLPLVWREWGLVEDAE